MHCLRKSLVVAVTVLSWISTHAQASGPELEKSLAVIDFSLGEAFEKTPAYCGGGGEKLKTVGKRYALLSRGDTLAQLRSKMGGASRAIPAEELAAQAAQLKDLEDLIYEKPKKAITPLKALIGRLQALSRKYAINAGQRALMFDAFMKLARANNDSGNTKGLRATLVELIRFVGDATVTDETYHPAVVEMWKAVKKSTASERTATLSVTSTPAGSAVLINGEPINGATPMSIKWFPGRVQVQITSGGKVSNSRAVELVAGDTTELAIDLEYESGVELSKRAATLVLGPASFEARAAEFAKRLGGLLEVDRVALCGLTRRGGKVYIEGHLVDVASGRIERGVKLVTKSNVVSKNRVQGIANFIATGQVGSTSASDGSGTEWQENPVGWSLVGVGLAGIGVGVAFHFVFEDKIDQVECLGDYTAASGNCPDFNTRQILAEEAELERGVRNAGLAIGGVAIVGGIIAFIVMQPSGSDESTAEGPTLKSLGPWTNSHTTGMAFALGF